MADTTTIAPPTVSTPDSSTTSSPALIVTSGASRSAYADNVNTLQSAVGNLQQGNTIATPNADVTPQNTVDAKAAGWTPATTSIQTNPDGTTTHTTTAAGGSPVVNSDGSTTNPDGSTTPAPDSGTGGELDPALKQQYEDNNAQLDQGVNDAKATLSAVSATLANDPAAQAAVAQISAQYDQLITAQQNKNKIILGGYAVNAARTGSLQYANDMTTQFLNDEQSRANDRVADLVTKENNAILKSNAAYQAGDVKAFNAATQALKSAQAAKIKGITDLATATSKALKDFQTQQKIDATNQKQQIIDDIRVSTSVANTVAQTIKDSGITDEKQIDAYIQAFAQKSGISNPDILKSAVLKSQQTQGKLDLSAANTKSEINKRNQPKTPKAPVNAKTGKDGSYTYTPEDISTYSDLLNKGGTGPDGTVYPARSADEYADTSAYVAALNDWVSNGGTPAGFNKQFPAKDNVDPADYSKLPKAIQPKASTTAAAPL